MTDSKKALLAGLALSAAFNLTPLLKAQQAPPVAPPPTALKAGDMAPDFTLPATDGTKVTLSSFRGKKTVVLAFFPAAFSSVCEKELCTFRDSIAQLNRTNAQVFGISVDTFFALKAFQDQQHLTFPLLSDFNKQVIRDYGVFNEDMIGLKGIAKRATFVIDTAGKVVDTFASENLGTPRERATYVAALAKLS